MRYNSAHEKNWNITLKYIISESYMVNTTKAPMEDAFVVYYRCYCPILVTERGWKRVWRIGFFNCIHRSRCNLSLHLQVARWIFPSVTSTKKGGWHPSFFVCVKTCHTLVSFVTYYITQFTIICKWSVIVIKKQGDNPAFSFCVQHIERINFLAIYYMII